LPTSSSSGDELTVSLIEARPDPLLGPFESGSSPEIVPPPESESADALKALGDLDLGGKTVANPGAGGDRIAPNQGVVKDDEDLGDFADEPEEPARGSSPAVMLLASYASAVTLGLIWVLWTGRRIQDTATIESPPAAEATSDPGRRADHSRRIAAPKPIPESHMATLGKTVVLGQIEVTPLEVTSGPVTLVRGFGERERKPGGKDALRLRLRLRNTSADVELAPLDEAFLRDRPQADPDSFIELPGGATPIAQFPLAVESEWSIIGQEFRELKPGQVLETWVVSAPAALTRKAPEMTWRIRLRTDINHTDDLGVRFGESDIKPGTEPRAAVPAATPGPSVDDN
jgi:hypothetical protein